MPVLLHGTTLERAKRILTTGPDPLFIEPGGHEKAGGVSMCLKGGPFPLGRPEDYACGKTKQFPQESGPAIVAVNVPDEIIDLATNDFFPRSQGVVQFDEGAGLEELRGSWSAMEKQVLPVECP